MRSKPATSDYHWELIGTKHMRVIGKIADPVFSTWCLMGRPREFNEADAIERAMTVFWEKGYEAASLPHLLARMGLTRGSFYKAFKGKRAVYLAAIARYDAAVVLPVVNRLKARDGASGPRRIVTLFRMLAGLMDGPDARKGCFLCKAAVDRAPHDVEVERAVTRSIKRLEAAFRDALLDSPAPQTRRDAGRSASQLTATYMGIQVLRNAGSDASTIKSSITQTLMAHGLH